MSGLISKSGIKTMCGGIEGSVVKADVDESKVWPRAVGVCVCI